jgi:hypothetical protein
MGMSTHVVGFRIADEKFKKMKALWLSCDEMQVPVPDEVENYFEGEHPCNMEGCEVELGDALEEYDTENGCGYQIDVSKLPKDLTILRFYNSY